MTYKEIKSFIEKFNVRHELNPIIKAASYYDFFTGVNREIKIFVGWELGICNIAGRKGNSEWQWTWFKFSNPDYNQEYIEGCEPTDDAYALFVHRYSMVNGKSYKGVREWLAAETTIERRMAR